MSNIETEFDWNRLLRGVKEKIFKSKNPRIENRRLLLSYSIEIEKEDLRRLIHERTGAADTGEIIIGVTRDSDGEMRTHAFIDFCRIFVCKREDCEYLFDYVGPYEVYHPLIRTVTDRQVKNVLTYISRDDPELVELFNQLGDPSKPAVNVEHINSYSTTEEAIKNCAKSMYDVIPIIKLREVADKRYRRYRRDIYNIEEPFDTQLHPWYQSVISMDKTQPHRRHINWYWDKQGNAGKTMLAEYMCEHMKDDLGRRWARTPELGTKSDAAEFLQAEFDAGWTGHGVIVDLDRTCAERRTLYGALEDMKNGYIRTRKYRGSTINSTRPHVVVLSNKLPIFDRMSADRWRIHIIKNYESQLLDEEITKQLIEYSALGLEVDEELMDKLSTIGEVDDEFDLSQFVVMPEEFYHGNRDWSE